MLLNMLDYYNMVKELNISIVYSGPVWSGGIESIASTLRKRLQHDELSFSISQSVFSVFVEQMNNILMYSAEKETFVNDNNESFSASKGLFVLGMQNEKYFLQSSNLIKDKSAELIKSKIDYLNTLDKAQMRKYYKERIKSENTNPESKGAGLGFIEIARRSSSKIEYSFEPYGNGHSFFTLHVII